MTWPDDIDQNALPELPPLSPANTVAGLAWGPNYAKFYNIDFAKEFAGLRHYLGYFDSAGERIAGQVFALPDARLTAYLYHGYYDHVGLLNNAIAYCLRHDCSVVAYDLPGHGLSSGKRAAISDFQIYRQVLRDAFAAVAVFDLPASKIALAQSTGCAILMSHLLEGGEADFEKSVLMAPLVRPRDWWWGRPAHAILKYFIPSLPRKFADNSDDQAFLEFLRARDPLQPRTLPLSWVGALKKWLPWFLNLPANNSKILVVQGDSDDTVDWPFNLSVIRKKFPQLAEHHITGARHHLVKEGEVYRQQLWQACDEFLF